MALTAFRAAYQRALGQAIVDPVPVEPDEVLEPLTAEEANARTRATEDRYFMILEPDRNQRRILSCDQAHYAKFGRSIQRNNCS